MYVRARTRKTSIRLICEDFHPFRLGEWERERRDSNPRFTPAIRLRTVPGD